MSNTRAVLQVFEKYQKARVEFVQTVAEAATRPQNIEALQNAGVMSLLRPLLLDNVPSIQQSAAIALGRLANYNDELAEAVVSNEILPQLVFSLAEQNRFYKQAAAFVLRAVAKHSPVLAQAVVDSGALDALVGCLEEFDPAVKESAAWALGYIARHNAQLAQSVVDAGAISLLILCVQEPELSLKRISASALSDISKHTPELAQAVVDGGAVAYLAPLITYPDGKLKRQVCSALGQIAKHSVDLAEVVVEADIFPKILTCLKDADPFTRKNACTAIREVVKHTPELAQLIVSNGGAGALVDYTSEASGNNVLPGVMALGYIAAFSETLALAVIMSNGVRPLLDSLVTEQEDHIKSASAWSLGQIGRHSPDHSKAVSDVGALPQLVAAFKSPDASDDLKTKCKRAVKSIVGKSTILSALEPLITICPEELLKPVISQIAKILPNNAEARTAFVKSGALQRIQQITADEGSVLREAIEEINGCYPEEIVKYYSPNYADELISRLDGSQ